MTEPTIAFCYPLKHCAECPYKLACATGRLVESGEFAASFAALVLTMNPNKEIVIRPECHPSAPTWVKYQDGTLRVECYVCNKTIVELAVPTTEFARQYFATRALPE